MSTLRDAAKAKSSTTKSTTTSSSLRTKAASRPKTRTPAPKVMDDPDLKQEQNYKPPKFNVEPPPLQFGYIRAFSRIPGLRRRVDPNAS